MDSGSTSHLVNDEKSSAKHMKCNNKHINDK